MTASAAVSGDLSGCRVIRAFERCFYGIRPDDQHISRLKIVLYILRNCFLIIRTHIYSDIIIRKRSIFVITRRTHRNDVPAGGTAARVHGQPLGIKIARRILQIAELHAGVFFIQIAQHLFHTANRALLRLCQFVVFLRQVLLFQNLPLALGELQMLRR